VRAPPMPPLWPGRSHSTRVCGMEKVREHTYYRQTLLTAAVREPAAGGNFASRENWRNAGLLPRRTYKTVWRIILRLQGFQRLHGHVLTVCNGKCGFPAIRTRRGCSHIASIHENNGTTTCRENYGYRDPATTGTRAYSAAVSGVNMYICTTPGPAY